MDAYAAALTAEVAPFLDRPYAFIGHCGALPNILGAVDRIVELDLPLPRLVIASAWGAPHRGLHGRLSYVDLRTVDLLKEIRDLNVLLGRMLPTGMEDIAVDGLRSDIALQRTFTFRPSSRVACPVAVLAWSHDTIMPPAQVQPGWDECADVEFHLLEGDHGAFLHFPVELRVLIERSMAG